MKILIAEDEPLYADQLEMLCEQLGYEVVGVYEDAFSTLDAFHREQPDLLLSDINLAGEIDGIQLAEKVNAQHNIPIIFITSLQDDETFARAQSTLPVAFIVKPFKQLQLQRSIELAVSRLAESQHKPIDFEEEDVHLSDSFFVKVHNRLVKVQLRDILYIEADGRYSMIHTLEAKKYAVRIPIGKLVEQLNPDQFIRSHRSFISNLNWLESVDVGDMVIKLKGGEVPLSKGYKEEVLERIKLL